VHDKYEDELPGRACVWVECCPNQSLETRSLFPSTPRILLQIPSVLAHLEMHRPMSECTQDMPNTAYSIIKQQDLRDSVSYNSLTMSPVHTFSSSCRSYLK